MSLWSQAAHKLSDMRLIWPLESQQRYRTTQSFTHTSAQIYTLQSIKKDASRSQIVYREANGVVLTSQTLTLDSEAQIVSTVVALRNPHYIFSKPTQTLYIYAIKHSHMWSVSYYTHIHYRSVYTTLPALFTRISLMLTNAWVCVCVGWKLNQSILDCMRRPLSKTPTYCRRMMAW